MVGQGAFTREQLAILSQLIEAQAQERAAESDPRGLLPGTVLSYDPATRRGTVLIDGDDEPLSVFNKEFPAFQYGDRVFVRFEPPRGVFIDGIIRLGPAQLVGLTALAVQDIPNGGSPTPLDLVALTYDPYPWIDPSPTASPTIPVDGFYTLFLHARATSGTPGYTRFFCEMDLGGGVVARSAGGIEHYQTAPAALWCTAGFSFECRAFQVSGAPVNITATLFANLVNPGKQP